MIDSLIEKYLVKTTKKKKWHEKQKSGINESQAAASEGFQKGDKIKVTGGEFKGKEGTFINYSVHDVVEGFAMVNINGSKKSIKIAYLIGIE